jgi:hypothetical protein
VKRLLDTVISLNDSGAEMIYEMNMDKKSRRKWR